MTLTPCAPLAQGNLLQSLIERGRDFIPELKNTRDWNVDEGIQKLKSDSNISEKVKKILYRPFDTRYSGITLNPV